MQKTLSLILSFVVGIMIIGCDSYDDTELRNQVSNLESRVSALEKLCSQMNTNISSLQSIVETLKDNDYITDVSVISEGGIEVGYKITFKKKGTVNIYHGKNGKDGINGKDGRDGKDGIDGRDGKDGTNGKDGKDGRDGKDGSDGLNGTTPVLGVRQGDDGNWYWTINGIWLLDENECKVKATGDTGKDGRDGKDGTNGKDGKDGRDGKDGSDGKDGVTPQLKIDEGFWYISNDNGITWSLLGRATGANGKDGQDGIDGDSMFSNIVYSNDSDFVVFTLADGTEIKVPTWSAFERLSQFCNQINSNLGALDAIVRAIQGNDFVTSISVVEENGEEIGYKLIFSKSGTVTIYHGKDGKDGADGKDGSNGQNGSDGKNGVTPIPGIKQDTDGIWYWTMNGAWLLDDAGLRIKAAGIDGEDGDDGKDGIVPELKIENNLWYVSYDEGANWKELGKATGKDGDSFFKSVTWDTEYVHFTFNDDSSVSVPIGSPKLNISFSEIDNIAISKKGSASISYEISNGGTAPLIAAIPSDGFTAEITKASANAGKIKVTAPSNTAEGSVMVIVSDGSDKTIMRSLNFVAGTLNISTTGYIVEFEGGTIDVDVTTNLDYSIEISDTWLRASEPVTKTAMRTESFSVEVDENTSTLGRSATIKLINAGGVALQTITISQESSVIPNNQIWYTNDSHSVMTPYNVDAITDANIVSNIYGTTKGVITFDADITEIGYRAFYESQASTITIPESVTTLGEQAFGNTTLISFNIPESVSSINNACFSGSNQLKLYTGKYASDDGHCLVKSGQLIALAIAGLKSYTLPEGIVEIVGSPFEGFTGLQEITMPSSLRIIGNWGLSCYCSAVKKINFNEGLQTIGAYACLYLEPEFINLPNTLTYIGGSAFINLHMNELSLNEGLLRIDNGVFDGSSFETVHISSTITSYGIGGSFHNCKKLRSFSGKFVSSDSRAVVLDDGTMVDFAPAGLTEYTIPEGVSRLSISLFSSLGLSKITLSSSVKSIGEYCMSDSSISEIDFNEGLETIGSHAFSGCKNLSEVILPNTLTQINSEGFKDCSSLTSVSLGASCTRLYDAAFQYCYNLKTFSSFSKVAPIIDASTFDGISDAAVLYIPYGCTSAYSSWSPYFSSIVEMGKEEEDYALSGTFSVQSGKTVRFAQGNLYYDSEWHFEENQFDYRTWSSSSARIEGSFVNTPSNNVGLFYWNKAGEADNARAASYSSTSPSNDDTLFADNIFSRFRTLKSNEWIWLLGPSSSTPDPGTNCRTSSTVNSVSNARFVKASINGGDGLIIFPDIYSHPSGVNQPTNINVKRAEFSDNTYSLEDWAKMEEAGAVFLPAAGWRDSTSVYTAGDDCYYWYGDAEDSTYGNGMHVDTEVNPEYRGYRDYAEAIRLVFE